TGASSPGQLWAAGPRGPQSPLARQTTTFGTLGIVAGQTVRLSAVRQPEDEPGVTVCRVDLTIFDIHGTRQATVTEDLDPGKGAFVDLARAEVVPPPSEGRVQMYAVGEVTSNVKEGKPACQVALAMEIFDQADGRTRIAQGAVSAHEVPENEDLYPIPALALEGENPSIPLPPSPVCKMRSLPQPAQHLVVMILSESKRT